MKNAVTDRSSMRRYRTEIPNLVLEMDLSVYAFRLYVQLKRVAGDDGKCFYTTRQLAEQCHMGVGTISKAKQELIDADLIRVSSDGKWVRDNITIVDLWPANFAHFAQEKENDACSPHEQDCSPHEHPVHHTNAPVHVVNVKEEPLKKEPKKERESAPARTALPSLREPATKSVRVNSPHLDPRHFVQGFVPQGTGANAVEVYYERFSINQDAARLNAIAEDDITRLCPDLDKLREVVTAYSRTPFRPGNVQLILDWYRDGIPERHRDAPTNGYGKTSSLSESEKSKIVTRARNAQGALKTAQQFKGNIDPAWQEAIDTAKGFGLL